MSEFGPLFEPIKIGKYKIKNRLAMAPMGMVASTPDGHVTDQNISHYVARAKGGVGWITVEHTFATDKYGYNTCRILAIPNDRYIQGWAELAEAIHSFDVVTVVQLSAGIGASGSSRWAKGIEMIAPSVVPSVMPPENLPKVIRKFFPHGFVGEMPRELTTKEVEELEDAYAAAALRVKFAGFDGIEIHGAHGHLIAQFVTPLQNRRTDIYGIDRLLFPLNIIRKVRGKVGKDWIVGYRISADEHVDRGLTLQDTKKIVRRLVDAGLNYISVSSGHVGYNYVRVLPDGDVEGTWVDEAAEIKKVVDVPVFVSNVRTPHLAAKVLKEKKADLIALGRPLLADPDWANKVKDGRANEIIKCTGCGACVYDIFMGYLVKCPRNPRTGREKYLSEYWPPIKYTRKVMKLGGERK